MELWIALSLLVIALVITLLALLRQRRLQRALRRLLNRLLSIWRAQNALAGPDSATRDSRL